MKYTFYQINDSQIKYRFEFMAIKSQELDNIKQNYSSFQEHIDKDKTSFASRSGGTLIIPRPEKNEHNEELDYKNLASFIQNLPKPTINKTFWQKVAYKLEESLADGKPHWLSTHGLGVPYLHVRIDKKPIYYSYNEYKEFKENDETTKEQPKPTEPTFNNNKTETEKDPQKNDLENQQKSEMLINGEKEKALETEKAKENKENWKNSEEYNQKEFPWKIVLLLGAVLLGISLIVWLKIKQNKN